MEKKILSVVRHTAEVQGRCRPRSPEENSIVRATVEVRYQRCGGGRRVLRKRIGE